MAVIFDESEAEFIKISEDDSSEEGTEYEESIWKPNSLEHGEKDSGGEVLSKSLHRRRNGWPRSIARAACRKVSFSPASGR